MRVAGLSSILAKAARVARKGEKQVLAMPRRPEGATAARIADATGWARQKVSGFGAALNNKGHMIEVKSRPRMVGPNKAGAKTPFTLYAPAKCAISATKSDIIGSAGHRPASRRFSSWRARTGTRPAILSSRRAAEQPG
jgi:hypothetical protein